MAPAYGIIASETMVEFGLGNLFALAGCWVLVLFLGGSTAARGQGPPGGLTELPVPLHPRWLELGATSALARGTRFCTRPSEVGSSEAVA